MDFHSHRNIEHFSFFYYRIQLYSYNHYFLTVGDIFNSKDLKQIESKQEHYGTSEKVEWEVDDYHLQRLKELGLDDADEEEVNQYISRI